MQLSYYSNKHLFVSTKGLRLESSRFWSQLNPTYKGQFDYEWNNIAKLKSFLQRVRARMNKLSFFLKDFLEYFKKND